MAKKDKAPKISEMLGGTEFRSIERQISKYQKEMEEMREALNKEKAPEKKKAVKKKPPKDKRA
ncbi:MAG TPA: hypothetical protein PLQ76_06230 [bacterium]|nr:hypothetical protein [bacterium]